MSARPLTAVQLAERIVTVLKQIEDLEPAQQKDVLDAAAATCQRLAEKK